MDGLSSLSAIDQKMAEMRIKNLELLKRHQEIEEDRQLAQQSGATTITTTVESTMRSTIKNRSRNTTTQVHSQENQYERIQRAPIRRKYENDRNDNQPQRAQRIDYNRLKRERAQETINQQYNNNINPELLEYAYPFHSHSDNNYTNRVGSGRFNQQQRTQEQGQRRREERMRRSGTHNNGHPGGPAEFHLDMPQIPMWQNSPMHVQILPANINGHHAGIDPLMNNPGDQLDQSAYINNFMYSSSAQSLPFNDNGTVYFAPPPIPNGPPNPSSQSSQTHFHQYHPTRTFENSNRHQFPHSPIFQSSPSTNISQLSTPSTTSSSYQQDPISDLPPRFRRLNRGDNDNRYVQQRPMSGDFEHFHNSSSRFNNENRFRPRPQSFYDFSSNQQSNNNFFRSSNSNNNRYPRSNNINSNNNSLPLSAYLNTDDSSYENENFNSNNHWNQSYARRRTNQQRTYQDKHQFPLSSYDPRQYGFNNNNYQRRNDFNNRMNSNRRNPPTNRNHDANDIDLIEEWWEDDNPELIGTNQSTINNNDSQINSTTIDDSGNSSLSTSIHLKESILDDENNVSTNDVISPPSDVSITDNNIIDSLDQLQQQLKLEEDVEKQLDAENDTIENELLLLTKEQIKQHDAVATDDDDDEEDNVDDILLKADVDLIKYHIDPIIDDDSDKMDELEDDLQEKLIIEENIQQTIVVE